MTGSTKVRGGNEHDTKVKQVKMKQSINFTSETSENETKYQLHLWNKWKFKEVSTTSPLKQVKNETKFQLPFWLWFFTSQKKSLVNNMRRLP